MLIHQYVSRTKLPMYQNVLTRKTELTQFVRIQPNKFFFIKPGLLMV